MTSDGADPGASDGMIKTAEQMLRKAIAQHGLQHPVVLERLNLYLDLMQRAGRGDQVKELEEQAKLLRKKLNVPEPGPAQKSKPEAPAAAVRQPVSPASGTTSNAPARQEKLEAAAADGKHLYDSRGEHVATQVGLFLYTRSGRYVATWSEDLEAFINKKGWYFGHISDGNRLEREKSWRFKDINFGDKGGEGDRPGWDRQRDIEHYQLSPGCEDVKIDEFEAILGER